MAKYNFDVEKVEKYAPNVDAPLRAATYSILLGKPEPNKQLNNYPINVVSKDSYNGVVKLGGVVFEHVIMNCTRTKNIVSTAINGRIGTIKEFWSKGDVAITMQVVLISKDNNYPFEEVKRAMEVIDRDETLDVTNKWLNDVWDVTRLAIKSAKTSGRLDRNIEVITIAALSDNEYIIAEEIDK